MLDDRLYYREWALWAQGERPVVSRQPKASIRQRLWFWFWRHCLPPHTGYAGPAAMT